MTELGKNTIKNNDIAQDHFPLVQTTTDVSYCLKTLQISSFSFLVPMDVISLYTNISHEEGIATVCRAYDEFHRNNSLIPTKYLREMIKLILRQFLPIQWKELPSNPWYCYGHKNGRCFCKHFYR